MATRLTPPVTARLADAAAEQVSRNHDQRIRELAAAPAVGAVVIKNVVLPSGVGVQVAHGLGRAPSAFFTSPPRGAATAGVIADFMASTPAGNPNDLTQTLSLFAVGFGATITVDIWVVP